jgi:hypothetical protein
MVHHECAATVIHLSTDPARRMHGPARRPRAHVREQCVRTRVRTPPPRRVPVRTAPDKGRAWVGPRCRPGGARDWVAAPCTASGPPPRGSVRTASDRPRCITCRGRSSVGRLPFLLDRDRMVLQYSRERSKMILLPTTPKLKVL